MKSIFWITTAVCLVDLSAAHAAVEDLQRSLLDRVKIQALRDGGSTTPPSLPPIPPIRQAKVRVQINKITMQPQADGTFNTASEVVCSTTGSEDVYDLRGVPPEQIAGSIHLSEIATCDSTVAGKAMKVHISGVTAIAHDKLFGASPEDAKYAASFLFLDDSSTVPAGANFLSGGAGTTDLTNHSLLSQLFPAGISTSSCTSSSNGSTNCDSAKTEYFTANVDVQD